MRRARFFHISYKHKPNLRSRNVSFLGQKHILGHILASEQLPGLFRLSWLMGVIRSKGVFFHKTLHFEQVWVWGNGKSEVWDGWAGEQAQGQVG